MVNGRAARPRSIPARRRLEALGEHALIGKCNVRVLSDNQSAA
jgi:hypothetical protein